MKSYLALLSPNGFPSVFRGVIPAIIVSIFGATPLLGVLAAARPVPAPPAQESPQPLNIPLIFPHMLESDVWWQFFALPEETPGLRQALTNHFQSLQERAPSDALAQARFWLSEGLAVVDPAAPDSPAVQEARGLEREARFKQRGGWSSGENLERYLFRYLSPQEVRAFRKALPATATEDLRQSLGKRVSVQGEIARVGASPSGHLIFLNFRGVPREGFTAIIRQEHAESFRQQWEGFPESLAGKSVWLTGTLTEFRGIPQIELTSPDQLEVEAQEISNKKGEN